MKEETEDSRDVLYRATKSVMPGSFGSRLEVGTAFTFAVTEVPHLLQRWSLNNIPEDIYLC